MKRLIWIYYLLWIFEGALRKWFLPSLSDVLLLIRDPIVIILYAVALASGIFPRHRWLSLIGMFSLVCVVIGLLLLPETPIVVLYGYQSDFLQLAVVFLIPKIFDREDLHKVGYWTLVLALLEALLMIAQFAAPAGASLNVGVGGSEGGQIGSALGHIRPPGTFSYNGGIVEFFALVTVFLLYSQLAQHRRYPLWLILFASISLLSAVAVSGSRSLLSILAVVFTTAIVAAGILQPKLCLRLLQAVALFAVAGYIVSYLPFFSEGVQTFAARIESASATEGGASGFTGRVTVQFEEPFKQWTEAPILGYGLGAASNVGTRLLGHGTLSLGEDEVSRVISELGPIFGSVFLLFRLSLICILGYHAAGSLRLRRDPLSILLLGAVFPDLLLGTFGITTTLGFIIFLSGCSLCAARGELTPLPGQAPENDLPSRFAASGQR